MGMLRTTFILGAVIFALPSPPPVPGDGTDAPPVSTVAYVAAAAEAFGDVKGFCARKPFVCETAGHLVSAVERKAKYSAKLIYEWANEATAEHARAVPFEDLAKLGDDIQTGSTVEPVQLAMIEVGPFLIPDEENLITEVTAPHSIN
jgi:hypothetical protein